MPWRKGRVIIIKLPSGRGWSCCTKEAWQNWVNQESGRPAAPVRMRHAAAQRDDAAGPMGGAWIAVLTYVRTYGVHSGWSYPATGLSNSYKLDKINIHVKLF